METHNSKQSRISESGSDEDEFNEQSMYPEIRIKLDLTEKKLEELMNKYDKTEKELQMIKDTESSCDKIKTRINHELKEKEQKIKELVGKEIDYIKMIHDFKTRIKDLNIKSNNLKSYWENDREKLKELKTTTDHLNNENSKLKIEITTIKRKNEKLEKNITNQTVEMEQMSKLIKTLNAQITYYQIEVKDKTKELKSKNNHIFKTKDDVTSKINIIKQIKDKNKHLNMKLSVIEKKLAVTNINCLLVIDKENISKKTIEFLRTKIYKVQSEFTDRISLLEDRLKIKQHEIRALKIRHHNTINEYKLKLETEILEKEQLAKVKGIGLNIKEPLIARLKEFIKKNDELEDKLFHKNFTVACTCANGHPGTNVPKSTIYQNEKHQFDMNKKDKKIDWLKARITHLLNELENTRKDFIRVRKNMKENKIMTRTNNINLMTKFGYLSTNLEQSLSLCKGDLNMNKERLKEFQRAMKNMENKYRILNMENIDLKTKTNSHSRLTFENIKLKNNLKTKENELNSNKTLYNEILNEKITLTNNFQSLNDKLVSERENYTAKIWEEQKTIQMYIKKNNDLMDKIQNYETELRNNTCKLLKEKLDELNKSMSHKALLNEKEMRSKNDIINKQTKQFQLLFKQFENEQKNNSQLRIILKNLEEEIFLLKKTKTPRFVDKKEEISSKRLNKIKSLNQKYWDIIQNSNQEIECLKKVIQDSENIKPRVKLQIVNDKIPTNIWYRKYMNKK